MANWQPYHEALRVTLTRTLGIALVAGAIVAPLAGGLKSWPVLSLLMLWPSFGGHWIDLLFLNALRPRLPQSRLIQLVARLAVWFVGGVVLALGVKLTARLLLERSRMPWLTWSRAGALFVAVELIAHAALYIRGRPNFYDGLG